MPDQHEPNTKLPKPAPLAPEDFYHWNLTVDDVVYTESPPPIKSLILKGNLGYGHVYQKSLSEIDCTAALLYCDNQIKITAPEPLTNVETIYGISAGAIAAALFVAIPYVPNPKKQTEYAFDMSATADPWPKFWDKSITLGIKSRHLLLAIPYMIAKPLRLIATGFHFISNTLTPQSTKLKAILFPFTIIGFISNLIGRIFGGTSILLDPDMWCEIYNYHTIHGVYRGEKLKAALRQAITIHTKNALLKFLTSIKDAKDKIPALKQWEAIGLITIHDARCTTWTVTNTITFRHLDFLATQFPTSGFKKLVISATRFKDRTSVLFNFENFPDMPIYEAVRASVSLPGVYKPVIYNGVAYIDANCANNFPAFDHATSEHKDSLAWHEYYNEQTAIAAEITYNCDIQRLIIGAKPLTSPNGLLKTLYDWTSGSDVYVSDIKVNKEVDTYLDLPAEESTDEDSSNLAFNVSKLKLLAALKTANPILTNLLSTHRNDILRTNSYHRKDNPEFEEAIEPALLVRLFNDLNNPKIASDILFKSITDKSNIENIRGILRANIRNILLKRLRDRTIPKQHFFPNDYLDDNALNKKWNALIQKLEASSELVNRI